MQILLPLTRDQDDRVKNTVFMDRRIKDYHIYFIFIVLFLVQIIFISPVGEFALNDDWAHSLTIKSYLETGEIYYPSWLSSLLHVPILYGILLSKVFGFSFTLLRLTNLLLALGTVMILYKLLRFKKVSIGLSFGLSLLLWFNPIFLNLSYTFMGDIPTLFCLMLAIYFYSKGFERKNYWLIFMASIIVVMAFFIRQIALLLIVSSAVYFLFSREQRKIRSSLWLFGLPLVLMAAIYYWLNLLNFLPGEVNARFLPEGWSYLRHIIENIWNFALLLSMFLLPAIIALIIRNWRWLKSKASIIIGCFGVCALVIATVKSYFFPVIGNIINPEGLGPSVQVMQGATTSWGNPAWYIVTGVLCIVGLVFGAIIFWQYLKTKVRKKTAHWFIGLFGLLYFILLLPILSFDRYLIVLLPLLILGLAQVMQKFKWSKTGYVCLLFLIAIYSLVGTYNYLAWNKARWSLADRLMSRGVAKHDIEAGYEWNGWYLYKNAQNEPLGPFTPKWAPWYIKELSKGHTMPYIVSFSELGGYRVVEKQRAGGFLSNVKYIYANELINHK